jgi:tetratricopeptide (TPR) repeat protein
MPSIFHRAPRVGGVAFVLALALAQPATLNAADRPIHNLGEKTSEAFGKLKPLQDAKNWAGMLALLDGLIPTVGPTSYDMALILDMKAKLYATQELYSKAIEPWEKALQLSDANKYFDEKQTLDTVYFLSQLNYQEGLSSKVPVQQQQFIRSAIGQLKRWLAETKKVTPEASMLYASMLFNQAVANSEKVDRNLIQQARAEVERGLLLSIDPKEGFYALLLVILQQESDFQRASEVLEFLVKQFPQKKDYWPTLMAFYLNMANDKDEKKARANYIRAINTIERAQALGHMKTPKDNYNLVTLYITANQFSTANELLYAGLKSGTIESDAKTWGVLGYYYQQADKELQAIAILKEACQLFPTAGQLELQLGEIYRQQEKTKEAYNHYQSAVKKGNLDKPQVGYQLLAYSAFELDKMEEALNAVREAEKFPDAAKDAQLPKLKKAIQDAIEERKYKKEEAAKKKPTA